MNASSFFDKAAYSVLLIIFFAVPMTISFSSYDQFGLPKFFLTVLLCLTASLLLLFRSFFLGKMSLPKVSFIPLLFFGSMAASCLLSADQQTSLWGSYKRYDGLVSYFVIFALILMMFNVLNSAGRIMTFLRLICFSAFFLSLYGVLQFFGIDIWSGANFPFEARRSFATFGNPNFFASYLVLVIPIYLFFIMYGRRKYFYYLATFVSVFALTSSGTRAGLVGLFAGLLLAAFYHFRASRLGDDGNSQPVKTGRPVILFVLISIMAIGSVSILASGLRSDSDAFGRLGEISTVEGSSAERIKILSVIPYAAVGKPLFGDGNASFKFAFEQYRPEKFVIDVGDKLIADNAHNIYSQYFVENGVFVMLAFVWLVLFILMMSFGRVPREPSLRLQLEISSSESDHLINDNKLTSENRTIKRSLKAILAMSIVSYSVDMLFAIQEMVQSMMFWGLIAVFLIVADRSNGMTFKRSQISQISESDDLDRQKQTLRDELSKELLSESIQNTPSDDGSQKVTFSKRILVPIFWLSIVLMVAVLFFNSRKMFEADIFYKASMGVSSSPVDEDALVLSSNPPKIFSGYTIYRKKEIEDLLNYSDLYDDEKALDKSIAKAKELLKAEPRAIDNYALLAQGQLTKGIAFEKRESLKEAVSTTSRGIKLSPYWTSGYKINAEANFNLKNYRLAYKAAQKAFQLEPLEPETKTKMIFYRAQMQINETGVLTPRD